MRRIAFRRAQGRVRQAESAARRGIWNMKCCGRTLALAAGALALAGCEFIPGTDAHRQRRGEQAAAAALIDPSSALFRNVAARGNSVCGEVNGKNRMGAYVGFTRFVVDTNDWSALLEPASDEGGYGEREVFESLWRSRCGPPSAAGPRYGFDGSELANGAAFELNAVAVEPEADAGANVPNAAAPDPSDANALATDVFSTYDMNSTLPAPGGNDSAERAAGDAP
jgi:hypothetical protein